MKNILVSLDLEEFIHLPYLYKYGDLITRHSSEDFFEEIEKFLNLLKNRNIRITIFVVGELVEKYKNILIRCLKDGHEIACHGNKHLSVNLMNNKEFYKDTKEAIENIESKLNCKVTGFRAPSFSMSIEKLNILKSLNLKYDASMIQSNANEYYNCMDINKFISIDDYVYYCNGLYEFETPTFNFFNKKIPFAGGGFFRLIPYWFYKYIFNRTAINKEIFMIFVHPYELSNKKIPFYRCLNLKDKIRINLNRKTNITKFIRTLDFFIKNNYNFITYSDYIKTRGL